jgi:predicted metalloprotease with PDZ domain
MSHLFHPYLGDRGSWLAEGLATYYQNVLRARAGLLTPADAWEQIDAGFARGRGATRAGDDTLERAAAGVEGHPNFMRIYWSGTAYWLEADLELRRASGNRLSVDEALKRFDACCLPDYRGWQPDAFVAKLDALIGGDVFRRKFDEYRARRDFPDVKSAYAALGISRDSGRLVFDDAAPDASVRHAITAARPR